MTKRQETTHDGANALRPSCFDIQSKRFTVCPGKDTETRSGECDAETQEGIKARLDANGYPVRVTDHGYCVSLYVTDPNNLRLEFTVDHAELEQINAHQQAHAHAALASRGPHAEQ